MKDVLIWVGVLLWAAICLTGAAFCFSYVANATPSHDSGFNIEVQQVFQIEDYEITYFQRYGLTCYIVRHTKGSLARNGIAMDCKQPQLMRKPELRSEPLHKSKTIMLERALPLEKTVIKERARNEEKPKEVKRALDTKKSKLKERT